MADQVRQPNASQVGSTSDHFAWIRTRLALERTMMSWVRTSVALIGFGFTIVQFFERLQSTSGVAAALRPQAPRYLGLALIAAGILGLLISLWQYRKLIHYMKTEFALVAGLKDVANETPLTAIAVALLLIGLFAFGAVFLRVV